MVAWCFSSFEVKMPESWSRSFSTPTLTCCRS